MRRAAPPPATPRCKSHTTAFKPSPQHCPNAQQAEDAEKLIRDTLEVKGGRLAELERKQKELTGKVNEAEHRRGAAQEEIDSRKSYLTLRPVNAWIHNRTVSGAEKKEELAAKEAEEFGKQLKDDAAQIEALTEEIKDLRGQARAAAYRTEAARMNLGTIQDTQSALNQEERIAERQRIAHKAAGDTGRRDAGQRDVRADYAAAQRNVLSAQADLRGARNSRQPDSGRINEIKQELEAAKKDRNELGALVIQFMKEQRAKDKEVAQVLRNLQ